MREFFQSIAMSMAPTPLGSLALFRIFFQVRATIERTEDAAFGIGVIDMAESGDVNAIGIRRVDDDPADLARAFEADMGPCLARVGGFEHADAIGVLAADIRLAGADIDDVRVRGSDGDGADRADRDALSSRLGTSCGRHFRSSTRRRRRSRSRTCRAGWHCLRRRSCGRRAWDRRRAIGGRKASLLDTAVLLGE